MRLAITEKRRRRREIMRPAREMETRRGNHLKKIIFVLCVCSLWTGFPFPLLICNVCSSSFKEDRPDWEE